MCVPVCLSILGLILISDFVLRVTAENPHEPRMWVEVDEKGHQCAMLSFYPEFEAPTDADVNCLFLVDCSMSMKVPFYSS